MARTTQTSADVTSGALDSPNPTPVENVELREEPTDVPDAETDKRPPLTALAGIRYTGGADHRGLTVADLETLGAESPKGDLAWSASSGNVVAISEMNASTVDALLASGEFEAVEA